MAVPTPIELFRDAIEAARAALRDMDDDEVPARLRRVAASSARNLPAPLARAVLRELEADETLRSKALEAWSGEEPPGGGRPLAAYAFLQRDEGWVLTVAAEAAALGERSRSSADRTAELERDSLAAEVASLKERLRRERDEFHRERRELRDALEAERAPTRAVREVRRRADGEMAEARAAWRAREQELIAEVQRLTAELRRAQASARSERRARADAEAAAAARDNVFPADPAALARLLDDLAAHATALQGRSPVRPHGSVQRPEQAMMLDPSIRPDAAEAIDWLVTSEVPSVLVDGYNLGFQLAGIDAGRARSLAIETVRRLAAVMPATAVTVVFDSEIEQGEAPTETRAGAAAVTFTSGRSADDEIVDRVCTGEDAVVLSNDRDLRHRAEGCGAIALWCDALVEWSRRR